MSFTYITGSGTQANPYVISDKNGWSEFCDHVNNGNSMVGEYVELSADIRYNDSDENISGYSKRAYGEVTPTIGTKTPNDYTKIFRGDFNGNNHTLYGFNVKNTGSVIQIANGAHIHHVRFEKIVVNDWGKYSSSNGYNQYNLFACINVNTKGFIVRTFENTMFSDHYRKEDGDYVVLNDIVASGSVNFVTLRSYAVVTLRNILYSCDFIYESGLWADKKPFYLVDMSIMQAMIPRHINLNINLSDTFFTRLLNSTTGMSYIIKDNEICAYEVSNYYLAFSCKPLISISDCTSYNAFLIKTDTLQSYDQDLEKADIWEYIIRNSVSYFPESEFYNHELKSFSEFKRNYSHRFVMHRLEYDIYGHRGTPSHITTYNDDVYCEFYNENIFDSHEFKMDSNTLYMVGDDYGSQITLKSISFPDSLKKPPILVSDMQNTYINSLREIMIDEGGEVFSTTDTNPSFENLSTMTFSSDLNCYVPSAYANEYVYWNIRKTTDNYSPFSYVTPYYSGTYFNATHQYEFWAQGIIGLIRKGTTIKFGFDCISPYKTQFLRITLNGNNNISYTTDDTSYELKTYTNVVNSCLFDFEISFNSGMGGSGTEESPYLISNANQLYGLLYLIHYFGFNHNLKNVNKNFKNNYFKLTSNITFQTQEIINSLEEPTTGMYFTCIDRTDNRYHYYSDIQEWTNYNDFYGFFSGVLDGDNHIITGLYDQFLYLSSNAIFKNIYFKICNIVFIMDIDNAYKKLMYILHGNAYEDLNSRMSYHNCPQIYNCYISGYIDFSILAGRIKQCVIHNLKYYLSGYNMVAIDHYSDCLPDDDFYKNSTICGLNFIEPSIEISDCLFMENAPNILPTTITCDYGAGGSAKIIYTSCYNMYNNVYIGTYENAIFSPYPNSADSSVPSNEELIITQRERKSILDKYKKQYEKLYIKHSSLLRHEKINNCGTIIKDENWNNVEEFKTLDFINTWKMTEIGPVPKNLNIITRSITVSCSNVFDEQSGICKMYDVNDIISYNDIRTELILNMPEYLQFLKWDDTNSTENNRNINDSTQNSLWITYSMRTNETYSGGDGTKENPYQLSIVDDIYEFLTFKIYDEDLHSSFGRMPYMYYILTTDLEMNDVSQYDILDPTPYEDYTPVRKIFYGEFDGMNHRISGLNPEFDFISTEEIPDTIALGEIVGLSTFIIHFSGKLKNLIIDKVYIPKTENAFICGGIVCYAYSGNNPDVTEITNCKFMGVIDHCYINGLCGGIFAVTADSLNYATYVERAFKTNVPTSIYKYRLIQNFEDSLVYETCIMNLETQKIIIDNCDTVGSIRMSELIDPNDFQNSYIIRYLNNHLDSWLDTSELSWSVIKLVSGICNYCFEQGLPVYIQNTVNNMNICGVICSGLCTVMNLGKNLPVFLENSYNTGNITVTNLLEDIPPEQVSVFTASGLMTSFSNSYINIKNCYNNGEVSAYNAAGIHTVTADTIINVFDDVGLWSMLDTSYSLEYDIRIESHLTNCYNYNNITPLYNSEHTYAIEPNISFPQEYPYETEIDMRPISCYGLENTTTNDDNTDVTYLSSEEFKIKSKFNGWDFNNTWISPTSKTRPLLSENLEGDNLYRLKLSVNNKGFGTTNGEGAYEENTIVELLAVPFTSYKFEGWSDGNKRNPRNYLVDHNEYIQAIFRFDGYSIRLLDYEGLKRFRDNMKNYIREENDKKVDIVMAGDSDTPIYFNSAGVPTPCTSLDLNTSGNAGSATKLETPRNINGVEFDGTTDIMIRPVNIGLGNVNNTSDLDKPISNATQNALMLLESDIDKVSYDNITYRMIDDIFD